MSGKKVKYWVRCIFIWWQKWTFFDIFYMLQRWFLFCTKKSIFKELTFWCFFFFFSIPFNFPFYVFFFEYCIHHLSRVHIHTTIYIQKKFILQDPSFLALMYTFIFAMGCKFNFTHSLFYDEKNDFGIVTCCLLCVWACWLYMCI